MRRTALAAALICLAACAQAPPIEPPHVVLFVLDTVRADGIGTNGYPYPVSPAIDDLAAAGVNFAAAYAHSTWTKPSMATLFTGAFPDRHRVQTPAERLEGRVVAERLGPQLHTLAERFREGGYTTAAFVNQVHLQPKFGFDQGFEHYDWSTGKAAYEVNEALALWLETGPEGPLFIYVHYLDPHWPYKERLEEVREDLGPIGVHPKPPKNGGKVDAWLAAGLAPGSIEGLRARYDHGVAATDRALGHAVALLDSEGLLADAVVAVTSDHGEGFLEHGRLQHGYAPFEEVARVPLVIRPPAPMEFEPTTVEQPVGLIDLMPTLLELAGLPPTEPGDRGRSLVPLMRGAEADPRPIYAETAGVRALRSGSEKLLRYPDGRLEYYDLEGDPGEQRPLPCGERCRELDSELDLLVELAASWEEEPLDPVELDEADLERLRALGYLND